jgi:DivIVA domain-containing protein
LPAPGAVGASSNIRHLTDVLQCNLQEICRAIIADTGFRAERTLTAWFDEEDRLSPDELLTVTFPLSRLGQRGYDEESVRQVLRDLHAEFVRLVSERASLWQEVQRLRRRIIGAPADDPHEPLPGQAGTGMHARPPSFAVGATRPYAIGPQLYPGRVMETWHRRDEVMREARHYADRLLEDAHDMARKAAVSSLNVTPSPQSDQERRADQAELAYLRAFSDTCRAQLRAYTEAVLHCVEEWEYEYEMAGPPEDITPDQRSIGQ